MREALIRFSYVGEPLKLIENKFEFVGNRLEMHAQFSAEPDIVKTMDYLCQATTFLEKSGWVITTFGVDPNNTPYIKAYTLHARRGSATQD